VWRGLKQSYNCVQYSFWACPIVLEKIKSKGTVRRCYAVKVKVLFDASKEVGLDGNAAVSNWSCLVNRRHDRTGTYRSCGSVATVQRLGAVHTCLWGVVFSVALQPDAGDGLLILEVSRSHTTTHHSR